MNDNFILLQITLSPNNISKVACCVAVTPLKGEVSTGYILPSRSNLHFLFLTFGHSGAQP